MIDKDENPEIDNQALNMASQAQKKDLGPEELKQAAQDYAAKAKENEQGPMPKVDMNTFILSLSSSVLVHLGEVPDPDSGQTSLNLDMARHTIDILGMLEKKTKGNLTQDEEDLLKNLLFELRVKYVQKSG